MMRKHALALVLLGAAIGGCGTPSMGVDKDTFKAVDALYTAISLRDLRLVEQCEERLKTLRSEGKLPEAAAASLTSIIAEGKKGNWESSQSDLAKFMEGQRR